MTTAANMEVGFDEFIASFKDQAIPVLEPSIFSLGARGHYENPLSDLLAFFMDPEREHGFGTLVLDSLIEHTEEIKRLPSGLRQPPQREYMTRQGGRIDILLESEQWVLVVEAKINHRLANDFDDYRTEIVDDVNFRGKTQEFIILAPARRMKDIGSQPDWLGVSLEALSTSINNGLKARNSNGPSDRWTILLREVIRLIDEICSDRGYDMDDARFSFVCDNYANYQKAAREADTFKKHLRLTLERIAQKIIEPSKVRFESGNWRGLGTVFDVYPDNSDGTRLTFRMDNDGKVELIVYINRQNSSAVKRFESHEFSNNRSFDELNGIAIVAFRSAMLGYRAAIEKFDETLGFIANRHIRP